MKKINVYWDSSRAGYFVSEPGWDGGMVYLASDVDAREEQGTAVIKAQRKRIAELEGKLIKCGIERSWYASKFQQAMDIMAVNDPGNHKAVMARPAWDDEEGGYYLAYEADAEHSALKHDIERHVAICAEQETRIVELEKALREMSAMYTHVWDRVDGALVCMPENIARFEAAHEQAKRALMGTASP